jgi:serine protease
MSRSGASLVVMLLVGALGCGGGPEELDSTSRSCQGLAVEDDVVSTTQPLTSEGQAKYIVHFRAGVDTRLAVIKSGGLPVRELSKHLATTAMLSPRAAARLRTDPAVAHVEEDAPRFAMAQSTPAGITDVQAPLVWQTQAGTTRGVKTCIIDSGLHLSHSDLPKSGVTGFPSDWSVDGCGHGTHVAGTIAALNNADGVVGVVKNGVDLVIVKIFGDDCRQTGSSDLVAALDQCLNAGAKVINMSLGGDRPTELERTAFENAWKRGALLVAAAGNDGSTSMQYPASYASVISVAAMQTATKVASFSQKNAQVDIAAPGVAVLSTSPTESRHHVTVNGTQYSANHFQYGELTEGVTGPIVYGGLCGSSSASWSGKVVVCVRGSYSFSHKVTQVQNSGGAAAIIYNHEPGNFGGTLGSDSFHIPALSLSQEDGLAVRALEGSTATVVSQELTNGSGYITMSGTSMASPHVAGVAALIWGEVPNATNAQVRAALEATAKDVGTAGRDDATGYGLVQAQAALERLRSQQPNPGPAVAFSVKCVGTHCAFVSTSMDLDGAVRSWRFDLGEGTVLYGPTVSHNFKGPGPFNVTLTVTDDDGAVGQVTIPVSVVQLALSVEEADDVRTAKLRWQGVSETEVAVFKNGDMAGTTVNSGDFEEELEDAKTPSYQVCTRSLESCSSITGVRACN